jgi:hypothetical protein
MLLVTGVSTAVAIACAVYAYRLHRRCKYLKQRLKVQIADHNIQCHVFNGLNAELRRTREELQMLQLEKMQDVPLLDIMMGKHG